MIQGALGNNSRVSLHFCVIGMGAVGPVLAAALRQAGHHLVGVSARSQSSRERVDAMLPGVRFANPAELSHQSQLVLLTVRDAQLAALVEEMAQAQAFSAGQLVAHTAGAFGLDVLEPAIAVGAVPLALHPAQTFSGTSLDIERLQGVHWAVNAPVALMAVAQALVYDLGGVPQALSDTARPLYHAALAHGSNHLVTLVTQALRALQAAGIANPAAFAEPLIKTALERSLQEGEAGLSGPVVRGDATTIEKHMNALLEGEYVHPDDRDPALPQDDLSDLVESYRAMALATARRVHDRQVLDAPAYQQIVRVLTA